MNDTGTNTADITNVIEMMALEISFIPLSARYYLKGKALQALLSLLLALPALPVLFP